VKPVSIVNSFMSGGFNRFSRPTLAKHCAKPALFHSWHPDRKPSLAWTVAYTYYQKSAAKADR
jgi:hypothetical protein